ncbi:MAG TPA: hypothetical protein PLQ93_13350 [Bacteroidia bacterium]|nr:hypothetical protein [Bacteroidia bacterium]
MKQFYVFCLTLFSALGMAQAPQGINYQGVLRDNNGAALGSRTVSIKFEIFEGTLTSPVFTETQSNIATNALGLFSTQIGLIQSSSFAAINWGAASHSLQVSVDMSGGSAFVVFGNKQEILSVPYALYANSIPASYNATSNVLSIGSNNSFTLATPAASNPTITGAGINTVTSSGNSFTVDAVTPSITAAGSATVTGSYPSFTIASPVLGSTPTFTAVGAATVSAGPNYTLGVPVTSLSGTGSASVSGTFPNFTVNVPAVGLSGAGITTVSAGPNYVVGTPSPSFTSAGPSSITGVYPNLTISSPVTPSVGAVGIATVSAGPNYVVGVQSPSFTSAGPSSITGVYPNLTITSPQTPTVSAAGIASVSAGPNYVVGVQSPSFTSVGPSSITGVYPNLTLTSPVTPTVSAAGIATVSAGPNYVVGVQSPSFTSAGPSSITGVYPNLTLNSPVTPTVSAAGIATVSAGPNYNVGVQSPSYTSVGPSSITGVYPNLTLTSPVTPSVSAAGIATVSAGPNYNVGVQSPTYTAVGPTSITGVYPNLTITSPVPITPSISGAGIAVVSPTTGNAFTVTVVQPTFAYSNTTGSLTSGTSSAYITPTLFFSNGILSSGPASNSVSVRSGTNALWSTLGNAATNATLNFIGTTDNIPLNFRVNNQKSGGIDHLLENTFFGYQSGLSNTTGNANSAFGTGALSTNTAGAYNVAVGYLAMNANTSGVFNNAFGAGALINNTTGNNNSAFGYEALHDNITGNTNTGIGMYALRSNTAGIQNAGFGSSALYSNLSGSFNTAIGHGALNDHSTGDGNVALGYAAGGSNVSGTGNLFLGFTAGFYETGSNKLYISNSTTSVSPLIFGDFATGNIAIGTTSANAPLQFANGIQNRKVVLWDNSNNDHQFYGFGINNSTLRYQVDVTGSDHVFYAGTSSSTSNELFRIKGNGMIKMGSETVGQAPFYPSGGMVIRRLYTTTTLIGQVVAATDIMTLERDGTNGGWRINRTGGSGDEVCNCQGVTNTGAPLNKALNNLPGGVTQVYTNAENVVYFHCIFGDPYAASHITEVTLTRQFADWFWMGTVISTFNH